MSDVYPASQVSNIPLWLVMEACEPEHSASGNTESADDDVFGSTQQVYSLPAPQSIIIGDRQQYNVMNFKAAMGAASTFDSVKNGELLTAMGDAFDALRTAVNDLPIVGDISQQINAFSQQAINPREEVVFQKPDFRSFTFSWEFGSEESSDCAALKGIIDGIRKFSYPTVDGAFMYGAPSQWKLSLVPNSGASAPLTGRIVKFGKSILESINTNYTGAGIPVLTEGQDTPFINLELTFKETKLRTQNSPTVN